MSLQASTELARLVVQVAGVDARRADGFALVRLRDGKLHAIEHHTTLVVLQEATREDAILAFNVALGHDDPEGTEHAGQRACERSLQAMLGPARERVLLTPPQVLLDASGYQAARRIADEHGLIEPPRPLWEARERLAELHGWAARDDRLVETHPELGFTLLNEQLGGQGPLEHGGRSWSAIHERLVLLKQVGLRPTRSLGGVGLSTPKDVLDATIAAWSAHRAATGQAVQVPERAPEDPRTGRAVVLVA